MRPKKSTIDIQHNEVDMKGECVPWFRADSKKNQDAVKNDQLTNIVIGALIAIAMSALAYLAYRLLKAVFRK